jgi:hypothetical protein
MRAASYVNVIAILAVALSTGCAFQQKKVEEQLAKPAPINCATAQGDLRMLQKEKADVAQRILEGVTAVYPASLVIGTVAGIEKTKYQVAIGDYNDMIDKRIAEIKQTCGIQ